MSNNQHKSNDPKAPEVVLPVDAKSPLYKTELCKKFMEYGFCKYGDKCQFAHGKEQLRQTQKHPKYKTEKCKSFWATGSCRYGTRCKFLHDEQFDASGQIIEKDPYQYSSPSRPANVQPRLPYQEPYFQDFKYAPPPTSSPPTVMYSNPNSFKQSPLQQQQMPQPPLIIPAFYPNPNSIYDTLANQQQSSLLSPLQQQQQVQQQMAQQQQQQPQSPPLGLMPEQYSTYEQQLYEMNYELYQQQQQQQADMDPTKLLSSSPQPDMSWEELQQSQSSILSGGSCKSPASSASPPLTSNNNNNNIMSPSPPLPNNNSNGSVNNSNSNSNTPSSSHHPPLIPGRKYGITKDTLQNYGYQSSSGSFEIRKSSWGPDTMLSSEEMIGANRKRTWPMRSIREDENAMIEDMENMSINNSGDEMMMMYMDDGSRYNPVTGTRLPVFLKLGADSPPPGSYMPPPQSSMQQSIPIPPPPPPPPPSLPSQQQQQSLNSQSSPTQSIQSPPPIPLLIHSPPPPQLSTASSSTSTSNNNSVINSVVSSPIKSGSSSNNNNNCDSQDNINNNSQQQQQQQQQQSYPLF